MGTKESNINALPNLNIWRFVSSSIRLKLDKINLERIMMPFDYRWHVVGRVALLDGYGDVTLDEFEQLAQLIYPEQNEQMPLHVLIYSDKMETIPPLQKLGKIKTEGNRGWVIFVSADENPLGRFLATVATQLLGLQMRIVPSLEEAQALLKRVDQTLVDTSFPSDPHFHPELGTIKTS